MLQDYQQDPKLQPIAEAFEKKLKETVQSKPQVIFSNDLARTENLGLLTELAEERIKPIYR